MQIRKKSAIEWYVVQKVKEFRLNHELSQLELSHRLKLSSGFVGKVESETSPTKYNLNHINRLSAIFKCSPKDFFPVKSLE